MLRTPDTRSPRHALRLALALVATALLGLPGCEGTPTGPSLTGSLGPGQVEHWTTAAPASRGVSPAVLEELEGRIDAGDFGDVSSLLVVRGGALVYERYWDEWRADDLHRVYSVTKSITSLLVGIAHADGAVPDLETPVLDLLPQLSAPANPAAKDQITLDHVLTMRTGLEWDELSTNYSQTANPVTALVASSDWLQFVVDLPFSSDPGAEFAYNSGVSMLMSGVLAEAVDASPEHFAADRLFDELGIDDWIWSTVPGALTNGGWGLRLRPRDMATIGQMVVQGGSWDGVQIVPKSWIEASSVAATRFTDGTGYGFQWWLPSDDGGARPLAAWGYGGQFIVVIPSLDLVVASTAENFEGGGFTPYTLADWLYRAVSVAGD